VFLGSVGGVLVGEAFVLFRWERRTKIGLDQTGPYQEWTGALTGCKDWNGQVYIKSDCTVRRWCVSVIFWSLGGILHLQAQTIQ
jgi:hypothetical protein